jgi:hypothetical protein
MRPAGEHLADPGQLVVLRVAGHERERFGHPRRVADHVHSREM